MERSLSREMEFGNSQRRTRTMDNMNIKQWIVPFIDYRTEPVVNLTIDDKQVEGTIDTGATRVMMTSTMTERL